MTVATCVGDWTAFFADVISPSKGEYIAEGQTVVAEPASERQQALTYRAVWMRRLGMDEKEIEMLCQDDGGPVDLQEERDNLCAASELKRVTPSYEELKVLVDRVAPSKIADRTKRAT